MYVFQKFNKVRNHSTLLYRFFDIFYESSLLYLSSWLTILAVSNKFVCIHLSFKWANFDFALCYTVRSGHFVWTTFMYMILIFAISGISLCSTPINKFLFTILYIPFKGKERTATVQSQILWQQNFVIKFCTFGLFYMPINSQFLFLFF